MDPIVIFVALGFAGALIERQSGRVSMADIAQGCLALFISLIAAIYTTIALGTTTITAWAGTGYLGNLVIALGMAGPIIGPILLAVFYGVATLIVALIAGYIMQKLKP